MTSMKNIARTLKIGQIEKNPILTLGVNQRDVEKYGRVVKAYGNVAPAVVGQSGDTFRILAGQARLEACARNGIREIPAAIAEISGDAEQMKLALMMSTMREDGCPLSEGAFIDALITRHGVTRGELMVLLKKSKSWMSKRQTLSQRLSEIVKGMVRDGVIYARTAEEIAKMPDEVQVTFASAVVRDSLNKTNASQLVSLYNREDTDSALKDIILNTPLSVLDAYPANTTVRRKEKRGLPERIVGAAGFIIRMAGELKGLLGRADAKNIVAVGDYLRELYSAIADLDAVLNMVIIRVSPGEPKGGDSQ